MEPMGIVQARTSERIKENAANILDKLGLNMSTYINMALNQLIIQEGIPFSVKLTKSSYTNAEKINEVAATLKLEGLHLDENDIQLMQEIQHGNISFEQEMLSASQKSFLCEYSEMEEVIRKCIYKQQNHTMSHNKRFRK